MIKRFLIFCPCLFVLFLNSPKAQAQQDQPFKTTPKSVIGYIEYLPPDYHTNSKKYPVVIFLHGKGQSGPASNDPAVLKTAYNSLVFYGPPKFVKRGTNFPFVLVCPQLKNNYGDWPSWYVMEVIEHVKTYLRIDVNRIYLTGTSLGGGGAWIAAQDYPNYFAAVAPVAGSNNSTAKAAGIAASDMPVWAFHGDRDGVVPLSRSSNMVNAINGYKPKTLAKLTVYPGLGHNAYSMAYEPTHNIHSPNLYDWMMKQVNNGGTLPSNTIPLAYAGPDRSISLPSTSITLSGGASDSDGTVIDYVWTKVSGGNATITKSNTKTPLIHSMTAGTYVFKLTVTDNLGGFHEDNVTVTVNGTGVNAAPIANAGTDKTLVLPAATVNLTGTATDPDGSITSYTWAKVSGGSATLSGAASPTLVASGLASGAYVFRLSVKDNAGAVQSDDVVVTVQATTANVAPVANAGADKSIQLPVNAVTLSGSGSDVDGTIASYSWTKISGGSATLGVTNATNLAVTGMVAGTYVFRLTVIDNKQATHSDDVSVVVKAATTTTSKAPIANAGGDKTIQLPVSSVTLYGSATTSLGTISSYKWEQVAGTRVTLQNTTSANLLITGVTTAGTRVFKLTVRNTGNYSDYSQARVVFTSGGTARVYMEESAIPAEDAFASGENPSAFFDLPGTDLKSCPDCTVTVFNESKQNIYTGTWSDDAYQRVFNQGGLYLYRVTRNGKHMGSGKIYRQ
jgi:pimeloyl-ACP methyl ester carboxylesterase